jgi:hypothetical protein
MGCILTAQAKRRQDMADTSFQEQLTRSDQPTQAAAQAMPEKAGNRRERLAIALAHLERAGVQGDYAYSKAFRGLSEMGLIMKPLHYWSILGLMVFGFIVFSAIFYGVVFMCSVLDHYPRPVRGMMEAGPVVMFVVNIVLSIAFAAINKAKAVSIGLPKWKDL